MSHTHLTRDDVATHAAGLHGHGQLLSVSVFDEAVGVCLFTDNIPTLAMAKIVERTFIEECIGSRANAYGWSAVLTPSPPSHVTESGQRITFVSYTISTFPDVTLGDVQVMLRPVTNIELNPYVEARRAFEGASSHTVSGDGRKLALDAWVNDEPTACLFEFWCAPASGGAFVIPAPEFVTEFRPIIAAKEANHVR